MTAQASKKTLKQALDTYYQAMATYQQQGVAHEMAVRQAFAALLEATAKPMRWTLVMEYTLPASRKRIDGALFDEFKLPRGYWEAKDSSDELETEIVKKTAIGYPLVNTIFEDTRTGILYQNGQRVIEADLSQPPALTDLLTRFFDHTEAQIKEFHTAVQTFQDRIPELATALVQRIDEEQRDNARFVKALERFYTLCKDALNPNISPQAIREMLVQHLLTERLFRTIFDNPDFTRRNVIAAEIEEVIDALTSRSFSRHDFLKQLDYFYVTIEKAAATIGDFSEKQAFLNTVYERFFQGFSQKQADTHGIVYTPQEIVDFMCASVDAVLECEFGLSLSSEGVCILDPCVGTGNFLVNILRRLSRRTLRHKYEKELFCNEVMLLPYYIASLNIEHAYYDLTGEYLPFEGICFADTLDLAKALQLSFFTEENTERVERQKEAEITVIIGNPPYNMGQVNENDNNKNRQYDEVDKRISETYAKDSQATLKNKLYDMYVRFFRWAVDRLEGRDGVVCFVSNNSFVDQIAFDGMRKHLLHDFTHIYHVDLHGNVRQNPKLSGTTHNVFGIQVGVGITLLVRKASSEGHTLHYHRVPEEWRKEEKLVFLANTGEVGAVEWEILQPDAKHTWLTQGMPAEFEDFLPMGTKETKASKDSKSTIFQLYSLGVATNRDEWVYDFRQSQLHEKMQRFIENYNYEVFRYTQQKPTQKPSPEEIDGFLNLNRDFLKWTDRLKEALLKGQVLQFEQSKVRRSLYRPFTPQFLYFDHLLNQRRYQQHHIFPTPASEEENVVICVSSIGHRSPFTVIITNNIPNLTINVTDGTQCFPYYTYDEDGSNRRENITEWALEQFRGCCGEGVSKWDIFHYVYALLHHPTYRERYAENLKRELPRLPLPPGGAVFGKLVEIGRSLADLHLHYEQAAEYPLRWVENREVPWSWRIERMKLSRDRESVVVNESLTLAGIPEACFDYRLGNRSALEWVIDQYRVKTDKRSGITSDPNRANDPEYIVHLVERVVTVSVETVRLVGELAAVELGVGAHGGEPGMSAAPGQ
jgi:predicted helicase